ncbi:MAG: nuclear transport factor 2 family protein [Solirubrobacteraceae bacterium]
MTQAVRTAREVVELYNLAVWNEQNFALAEELFAEEVVRHGVDEVVTLTREQAVRRIEELCATVERVHFELPVLVAGDDGEHVAIVYQAEMTRHDGTEDAIASIEVFRVVDGRITDVYNNTHQHGVWR